MGEVKALYRYPVKGLSPERLDSVVVAAGEGFPGDRELAIALPETQFDPANPQPLRKTSFAVLVQHAKLASLETSFDHGTRVLTISRSGRLEARGDLASPDGLRAIEDHLERFIGTDIGGRPRIVGAAGHRFTDVSVVSREMMMAVSVINLATVRDLEARIGRRVDPLRFRANMYIDGVAPGAELDWVDRVVRIGDVALVGARRTRRCAATEVDPATAQRDLAVPKALYDQYGHMDCGVYLYVQGGGRIAVGSPVSAA